MGKTMLRKLLLLFSLAGIVFACVDDYELFSFEERLPPKVLEAKDWFESQAVGGNLPWESANDGESNLFKPDWKKAFWNEDSEYRVTEVHLVGDEKMVFVSAESAEKFRETGDQRYMATDTRLVIRTNKETNEKDAFMMVIYPDLSYLEKNLDNPLKDMTYLKRDKDFSGVIYYHDMDGDYVNGWKYIDGTAYAMYPAEPEDNSEDVELRAYVCYNICETIFHYTDWYVNGDYVRTTYNGSSTSCFQSCYDDGGGSYGGGTGGGGTGTGSTSLSAKAKRIIEKSSLNSSANSRLNSLIEELWDRCAFKYVSDFTYSQRMPFTDVRIDPTLKGNGAYDPYTGILSFKNERNITEEVFWEEFLHLYQDSYYPNGTRKYAGKKGHANIEFEAKLMIDILCILRQGLCPGYGGTPANASIYSDWLLYLTQYGDRFPTYADLMIRLPAYGNKNYWDFLYDLSTDTTRPEYNSEVDYLLMPDALQNIGRSSDCF